MFKIKHKIKESKDLGDKSPFPSKDTEYSTSESIRYHLNVAGIHKESAKLAQSIHGKLYRLSRAKYHIECAERLVGDLNS